MPGEIPPLEIRVDVRKLQRAIDEARARLSRAGQGDRRGDRKGAKKPCST